jgi:hypothetical protein
MQSLKKLRSILDELSDGAHYLFSIRDIQPVFPELGYDALKALLSRASRSGVLDRICTGVYLNPRVPFPRDLLLYHTAAKVRARHFNYLSLETILSMAGVISQVPIQWISLMSSGRSNTIRCGKFGTIEFVHTKKRPEELSGKLIFDNRLGLWRANTELALQDMRITGRPMDLIDWNVVHEEL